MNTPSSDSNPVVFETTLSTFQRDVIERSRQVPILIDVWADWCAPCKQLMPLLEKLVAEYGGSLLLAKVNADQEQTLVSQLRVRSLPTVFLLKDGGLADQFTGAMPESALRDWLRRHLPEPTPGALEQAQRLLEQGQVQAAHDLLLEAQRQSPDDWGLLMELAAVKLRLGDREGAAEIVAALPADHARSPRGRQLKVRVDFLATMPDLPRLEQIESALQAEPQSHSLQLQRALRLVADERHVEGIEALLSLGQARAADVDWKPRLLEVFDLLGPDHELTRAYRRKLYALLH